MTALSVQTANTLSSRRKYDGKILSLRVDTIQMGDREPVEREIVEHPGSIVVVPVTSRGSVLLVEQWRHPAQRVLLEAPAGTLDPGEDPAETAQRELREETGHRAASIRKIGEFWIAPGWCDEYMHAYLATGLTPDPLPQDVDEDLRVVETPLAEIPGLLQRGRIADSKSIAALLLTLDFHKSIIDAG